jgi:hypothetical protein
MTLGGWLLVALAVGLVLLLGLVLEFEAPRLRRPVMGAMLGAVILMALKPHLWWVLFGLAMAVCAGIVVLYLVAAVTAEVQRWRETRR